MIIYERKVKKISELLPDVPEDQVPLKRKLSKRTCWLIRTGGSDYPKVMSQQISIACSVP